MGFNSGFKGLSVKSKKSKAKTTATVQTCTLMYVAPGSSTSTVCRSFIRIHTHIFLAQNRLPGTGLPILARRLWESFLDLRRWSRNHRRRNLGGCPYTFCYRNAPHTPESDPQCTLYLRNPIRNAPYNRQSDPQCTL